MELLFKIDEGGSRDENAEVGSAWVRRLRLAMEGLDPFFGHVWSGLDTKRRILVVVNPKCARRNGVRIFKVSLFKNCSGINNRLEILHTCQIF